MSTPCLQCGASLSDADVFCPNCGHRRDQPAGPAAKTRFCVHCGKPLTEGLAFCTSCGARVEAPAVPAPAPEKPPASSPAAPTTAASQPSAAAESKLAAPAPAAPQPPAPAAAPPAATPSAPPAPSAPAAPGLPAASAPVPAPPPANKSNPLIKIAVFVLGFIALITVAGIGSCVYIGYRIKHKATEYVKELKNGPGPGGSAATSKYPSRPYADCESKDRTGFDDFVTTAAAASIPLKTQLTLTDIWTDFKQNMQDVEILHTVDAVQSSTIDLSAKRLDGKNLIYHRTLCIADMMHGRDLETMFGPNVPDTIAGSTMFTFSRDAFQELKAGRPAEMSMFDAYNGPDHSILLAGLKKGTFNRVEEQDVPYSIIVNGDQKDLPSIHAKASMGDQPYEAWVLDDAANPIVLKIINPKINWHITFVKITFPVEKKIEQDLAEKGRAEIYGIYFDFNSATLRPESAPVLKEISEALKDNPAWKIKIDGHTDNVGGDAYNLRLSQRRAEAVKQALITQYGISPERMTPEGFGASRPKATNTTIEGRALNRRVELVRQ